MPHEFVQRLTRRTSVCLLAPMLIGTLAVATRSVSAASASGSRSRELYNHPLLSEDDARRDDADDSDLARPE